jgi:hypothetical protein
MKAEGLSLKERPGTKEGKAQGFRDSWPEPGSRWRILGKGG